MSPSPPQAATTQGREQEIIAGLNADNSSPNAMLSLTYFTATITSDPTGVTYTWNFGDGVGTDVGPNPSYAYGAAGPYTAIVTATNALGDDSTTTLVTIQDVPITGLAASNDGPTPLGSPTNFTAIIAAGTGVTYDWDFGDGAGTDTGATPSYTYLSFGTFTATVTATNSSGWVADTTVVVVSSDPDILVPSSMIETLDPDETSTQTLTIQNVGGDDLNWFTLIENPGVGWLSETPTSGSAPILPSGSENVTVTFNSATMSPGTYNTILRIRSDDPDEQWSNVPVTLTVGCVPVTAANFGYNPSNPSAGDTINFTAIVTPSNATQPIYTWDLDGSPGAGATVTHTWSLSGTYSVALTVTNCSGAAVVPHSENVNVAGTLDITVNPLSLSATLNPTQTHSLKITVTNASTATANLVWNMTENPPAGWLAEAPDNGTVIPAGSNIVSANFTAPGATGVYTTMLQISSNDSDEPQVDVLVTMVVTTTCIPVSGVDFGFAPQNPQAGETVVFTASYGQGTLPISYTWGFGGGGVASGQVVTHSWGFSGTYSVAMTATNACNVDTMAQNVGVTGEPDITVAPLLLSALLETDSSTMRQFTIGNGPTATANLNWSVTEVPSDVTWLSETPGSGAVAPSGSDTVNVTFDATGLSDSVYNTTLRISSNDPDQPTIDISVSLTVMSCVPVSSADIITPTNPVVSVPATFTATVDSGSSFPIQYIWDFGDGTGLVQSLWEYATTYVVTHTYATSNTYHVVMTATNICSFTTNVSVDSEDIFVPGESSIRVKPLSLSARLNPNTSAGQTVPRELLISNADNATTDLTWSLVESPSVAWLDEGITSGVISPSGSSDVQVTFNSTGWGVGTYTTTLLISSNDQNAPQVAVDVTLEVIAGCIEVDGADFDFTPTGPITTGDTIVFTGTVEQGTLPIDYSWDFGDGTALVVQNGVSAHTSVVAHTYTGTEDGYHVTMRATNTCGEDSATNRVGNPVIYLPAVMRSHCTCTSVSITSLSTNSPMVGEKAIITATVSGSAPITYTWDLGNDGAPWIGPGGNVFYFGYMEGYSVAGTFMVTLDVANGCPSTDTGSITITVAPPATLSSMDANSTLTMTRVDFAPTRSPVDEMIPFINSLPSFDAIIEPCLRDVVD